MDLLTTFYMQYSELSNCAWGPCACYARAILDRASSPKGKGWPWVVTGCWADRNFQ